MKHIAVITYRDPITKETITVRPKYRTTNCETNETFMFDTLREADAKLDVIMLSGEDDFVSCCVEAIWPDGLVELVHTSL